MGTAIIMGFSFLLFMPFWLLGSLFSHQAVTRFTLRFWIRVFASIVAVGAALEGGACAAAAVLAITRMERDACQLLLVVAFELAVALGGVLVAGNVTPRRRIVLIRRFNSPQVYDFFRQEVLPYVSALGRVVTLSDRLLKRVDGDPIWHAIPRIALTMLAVAQVCIAMSSRKHASSFLIAAALVLIAWSPLYSLIATWDPLRLILRAVFFPKRTIRVRSINDIGVAGKAVGRMLSARVRLSLSPPVFVIECADAYWMDTIETILEHADVILLVTDSDSVCLDWELQAARNRQVPVLELNLPSPWQCVHDELATALRRVERKRA